MTKQSMGMFSVSAEYVPTTALITCSGPAGRIEICAALAFGGEIARLAGHVHFLFDLLAVDFEGSTEERLAMGRYAATQLAGVERVAVVLTPEVHTGEGEQAARVSGIDLRNFHSLQDGLDWLGSRNPGFTQR
jgi:hypothetical protein